MRLVRPFSLQVVACSDGVSGASLATSEEDELRHWQGEVHWSRDFNPSARGSAAVGLVMIELVDPRRVQARTFRGRRAISMPLFGGRLYVERTPDPRFVPPAGHAGDRDSPNRIPHFTNPPRHPSRHSLTVPSYTFASLPSTALCQAPEPSSRRGSRRPSSVMLRAVVAMRCLHLGPPDAVTSSSSSSSCREDRRRSPAVFMTSRASASPPRTTSESMIELRYFSRLTHGPLTSL
jgi:hypothetical protein